MGSKRLLKTNELEIVWADRRLEFIQTEGWTFNGLVLMYNLNGSMVVIPASSIKSIRATGKFQTRAA